jgi:sortase B
MNKGKAATALAVIVALLALTALAVLPQSEKNPYGVHEVPATEEDATMEVKETGGDIDWDSLPASVVAWVRVPGTTVDYPIVRGEPESPDFYLTHDAGGERSAWGAPYIDAGCAQGAESPLVIVYGHHMSDGTMFAPLAQYSSRDFAEGHRTIWVFTREKAIELEVFAADVLDASAEGKRTNFADAAELDAYLGDKLSRCEVVLEESSNVARAWAFVTCSYQTSNSRTVVYAKEVEGWDSRPSE